MSPYQWFKEYEMNLREMYNFYIQTYQPPNFNKIDDKNEKMLEETDNELVKNPSRITRRMYKMPSFIQFCQLIYDKSA